MSNILSTMRTGFRDMPATRRNSVIVAMGAVFLLVFTYSVVRSNCDSLLLSTFGAEAMPYAWVFSVLTLMFTVAVFDKLQLRVGIHKLYIASTTIVSVSMFAMCTLIFSGINLAIYPLYILKEVYIVILLSSTVGYLNANVPEDLAKAIYGFIAALGSAGGLLGGVFSGSYVRLIGMDSMLYISAVIIFILGPLFYSTDKTHNLKNHYKGGDKIGPVRSLRSVKGYSIAILLMVMLSQFVVGLTTQKMNIHIANDVVDIFSKTELFGKVYATVSGLSICLDLLLVPLLFRYFRVTTVHVLVPTFHLLLGVVVPLLLGGIYSHAVLFISVKALDYSIFSVGKEFLYFPLEMRQRYGIKYVADMFMGRFSKGIISIVLIFIANISTMSFLVVACLVAWIVVVAIIARISSKWRKV